MCKLLSSFFLLGIFSLTANADPLFISGTGGLEPQVSYNSGEPEMGIDPSISFIERFTDIPASLNTEGVTDYIQLTLSAPEGYQFTIAADTSLSVAVSYVLGTGADIGFAMSGPVQVSYAGLVGNAPSWSSYSGTWSKGFNFTLNSSAVEEFSFTSIIFNMPISGIGLDSVVFDNGDHQFSVYQSFYTGEAPPHETPLLAVHAIPEPGYIWTGIIGLCGLLALKRKKQAC